MENNEISVVVIGTSAGGFNALPKLLSQLQPGTNAAYFVVMHMSKHGPGNFLAERMQKATKLQCKEAENDENIEAGKIYFACPDKHMVIKHDRLFLGSGPEENHWRPSIDVLFRSAAIAYRSNTIGILLTGMLYDGAAGMAAISKCGGTCIVQDPQEADFSEMPLSALKEGIIDHAVPISEMGALINEISSSQKISDPKIPPELITAVDISLRGSSNIDELETMGESSVFTCPDCGGVLFKVKDDDPTSYRCHTGHAYSVDQLELRQHKNLENALWVALRMLEERRRLLCQLTQNNQKKGFKLSAANYQAKVDELEVHTQVIRKVLFSNEDYENKPVTKSEA